MIKTLTALIISFILSMSSGCSAKSNNLNNDSIENVKSSTEIDKSFKRKVAYFTSWSAYERGVNVSDIEPSLITHINFAFANLQNDGKIIVGDSWIDVEKPFEGDTWEGNNDSRGHFNQLRKLKSKYPHIKILISVGGWTWSGNFSSVSASEEKRKVFADSAAEFVSKYGFDGVDIDWEFPVEGGNNIEHRKEDKQNYTKLLQQTRKALDEQGKKDNKTYLLTIAGGPNVSFAQNTELKEMMKYLDFINIMTYDYHGAWENTTGHNSPLYEGDKKDGLSVSKTIEAYLKAGVKAEDINLGLAFYGRGWTNVSNQNNGLNQSGTPASSKGYGQGTWEASAFDYWDLQQNYINKNGYKRYFDSKSKVPYLFNGSVFISYDDEDSIKEKLDYVSKNNIGGIMFWEFSGDKNKTLQKFINDYIGNEIPKIAENAETEPKTETKSEETKNQNSENLNQWNKDKVYTQGDKVIYNNKKYKAKWWTQGETPDENIEWGPWELI